LDGVGSNAKRIRVADSLGTSIFPREAIMGLNSSACARGKQNRFRLIAGMATDLIEPAREKEISALVRERC
jgi:hypothetical protein